MKLLLILLSTLFAQANAYYAQGDYAQAGDAYEQVLTENPSAQVYYNLANARFKQGELAQAIINYERALRLDPNNKDIRYNLAFAQTQIVDNIEDHSAFFLSTWASTLRNQLRESTWTILSWSLFCLALVAFLIFAFSKRMVLRKSTFYIGILAGIISLCSLANALSLHQRDTLRQEAIITQGIVNGKSSPDRSGTDLFTLHEGTKVTITDQIGDWCCVRVGSHVGWLQLSHLTRI